jgi:hypothetical protein
VRIGASHRDTFYFVLFMGFMWGVVHLTGTLSSLIMLLMMILTFHFLTASSTKCFPKFPSLNLAPYTRKPTNTILLAYILNSEVYFCMTLTVWA